MAHFLPGRDATSIQALRLLESHGVMFVTVPTDDTIEPELFVGRELFRGLDEIQSYLSRLPD